MFKITLNDMNCNPICDGTVFWFVENLEDFERKWLPLMAKEDIGVINRYYRSKFGEIFTDYYSDDPDLNIVQQAESETLCEKDYAYEGIRVQLINAYDE